MEVLATFHAVGGTCHIPYRYAPDVLRLRRWDLCRLLQVTAAPLVGLTISIAQ